MDFRYVEIPARPDAAFPLRRTIKRPRIRITLEKNGKSVQGWAIMDSGADVCVFPASVANALEIAIPNQRATPFSGTANAPQLAYFEEVIATIWNGNPADPAISFDLYAGFCDTLEHVGIGLLGQDGFFSRFKIAFDYSSNFMSIDI